MGCRLDSRDSRRFGVALAATLLVSLASAADSVGPGGALYGTVLTHDGQELTGSIEWGGGEQSWSERLVARKPAEEKPEDRQTFTLNFLGLKLFDSDDQVKSAGSLTLPFGHIRSIEPLDGRRARITLKNGEAIEAIGSGSDLGPNMKIAVTVPKTGRSDLRWRSVKRVQFKTHPGSEQGSSRLYGTAETRQRSFEGFIEWDRDETRTDELLDGDDDEGVDRSILFAEIREIRPVNRESSLVVLKDGSSVTLGGTNDVARGHRGVAITVEGVGVAALAYEDVVRVSFRDPPAPARYAAFDGGARLRGTVKRRDGSALRGLIVWDLDERFSWETLDGHAVDAEYAVPFENILTIEPMGRQSARVALVGNRELVLHGTNDVDGTNRGVQVITASGTTHQLTWAELQSVEFENGVRSHMTTSKPSTAP